MKKEISTEIIINSNPTTIWNILMDFEAYASWNPFISSIVGHPEVNSRITVQLTPPQGSAMTFRPIVTTNILNCKFAWKGKLFIKGLFDGLHTFELIDNINGTTLFRHKEEFSGIFIRIINLHQTKEGFRMMNEALKEKAERM